MRRGHETISGPSAAGSPAAELRATRRLADECQARSTESGWRERVSPRMSIGFCPILATSLFPRLGRKISLGGPRRFPAAAGRRGREHRRRRAAAAGGWQVCSLRGSYSLPRAAGLGEVIDVVLQRHIARRRIRLASSHLSSEPTTFSSHQDQRWFATRLLRSLRQTRTSVRISYSERMIEGQDGWMRDMGCAGDAALAWLVDGMRGRGVVEVERVRPELR